MGSEKEQQMIMLPKAFCTTCYEMTPYDISEREISICVRGISFTYPETVATCKECGKEVYAGPIADKNVFERHRAYYAQLDRIAKKRGKEG